MQYVYVHKMSVLHRQCVENIWPHKCGKPGCQPRCMDSIIALHALNKLHAHKHACIYIYIRIYLRTCTLTDYMTAIFTTAPIIVSHPKMVHHFRNTKSHASKFHHHALTNKDKPNTIKNMLQQTIIIIILLYNQYYRTSCYNHMTLSQFMFSSNRAIP